ncbi:alpha/beta-hydrolase [Diplogelasinospora grovesii]|uniref:Alpha/beta-hydrolase n=1 Tax=Diplogelasinospora grovesii TaxID=303347 RepID=A0AAN6S4I6_9PEZI|nr:alpha/beta-hydrolase [Diplogelasinospora grovesii]
MAAPKPFKISVPDSAVSHLKAKLASATFPDEVDFSDNWSYGSPLNDVKRLAAYWREGFDWRAAETRLNSELPQFTTNVNVDGFGDLEIHFVHQTSSRPGSIPLLFCHGWPGSFLEVTKLLPLLTSPSDPSTQSFHIVAPSLPNFGFSQRVGQPGFGIPQYAETCHKLMLSVGYEQYVTQGGDWGYIITRLMGVNFPSHCLASHMNLIMAKPPTFSRSPLQFLKFLVTPFTPQEREGLARTKWFREEGFGYNMEQSTKPHTLGFGLSDSPVALLAWIYEKLHDWTDSYPWTDDEVLTWISIYQFSKAGPAASVRIYYETQHSQATLKKAMEYHPHVKLGFSYFPRDLVVLPKAFGRTLGPVVFEGVHEDGGHFAAYERPEKLAEDLQKMFGKGGGGYGVTKKLVSKL